MINYSVYIFFVKYWDTFVWFEIVFAYLIWAILLFMILSMKYWIVLFVVSMVWMVKDLLFRLYLLQLKEYRWDKLKDFFVTAQGRKTLCSKKNLLRLIMCMILIWYIVVQPWTGIRLLVQRLLVFNIICIMVFIDIVPLLIGFQTNSLKQPDWTKRIILIASSVLLMIWGLMIVLWYWYEWLLIDRSQYQSISFVLSGIVACILGIQLFLPFIVGIGHIIVFPIAWFEKRRILTNAQRKIDHYKDLTTIGISGSYGKSSVKLLLSTLLDSKQEHTDDVLTTPGNINTELWISQYILSTLNSNHTYFICEFGTYKIGESKLIGEIVDQKIWFLTGLNNQHVWLFGSVTNAIAAETEILITLRKNNWILYANRDDHLVRSVIFDGVRLVRYSISDPSADAYVSTIWWYAGAYEFTLEYKKEQFIFKTDLIGKHNILNLTGVLACCLDQWIPYEILYEHTKRLAQSQKTLHITEIGWLTTELLTLIDDTYNINQNGVKAWLDLLSEYKGKKIVFIDEIIELGDETEQTHKELWQTLSQYIIDAVYLTGKHYATYIEQWMTWTCYYPNQHTIADLMKEPATILFLGRGTQVWLEKMKQSHVWFNS